MQFIVVPFGSSPTNDSLPDAKVGEVILREAQEMLRDGDDPRVVLARLCVKWGPTETIQAVAMFAGQENFRQAVLKHRVFAPNASPDESS